MDVKWKISSIINREVKKSNQMNPNSLPNCINAFQLTKLSILRVLLNESCMYQIIQSIALVESNAVAFYITSDRETK